MTKFQIEHDVNADEWNNNVIMLNGCCFHTYEWSLYSSEKNNSKPVYFHYYNGSGDLCALSYGLQQTKKVAGKHVYKTMSFGSLPAGTDMKSTEAMAIDIISYCRNNGIVTLAIHSFGTPFECNILQEYGFSVTKRWEFLVDINISKDDLWKKIHSKKRNLIRKGQKAGLQIEKAEKLEQVLQYRKLAKETYERKTKQGIPFPEPGHESYYKFLKNKLIDIGLGRMYLAYDGNNVVAGAFFAGYNKKAYYMLSSANEIGLKKAAPDLILWTCMTDYQKEGYKEFNLGGLSESELNNQPLEKSGLYHFKKRFSTDAQPCYKGALVLQPTTYKIFNFLKLIKYRLSS